MDFYDPRKKMHSCHTGLTNKQARRTEEKSKEVFTETNIAAYKFGRISILEERRTL